MAIDTVLAVTPVQDPGAPLRIFRASRGWTQAELAQRSGISRQRIAMIERGLGFPTAGTRDALAGALQVDEGKLFPLKAPVGRPGPK